MMNWLQDRVRAMGIIALLIMMTLFDSVSTIISTIGDGIMAIIAAILIYPWLVNKDRK